MAATLPALLLLVTSSSGGPQTFSLNIGFGDDSAPLTFFPDAATQAPSRSAPAPPRQPPPPQPLRATQPSVPKPPPRFKAPRQPSNPAPESHSEALRRNAAAREQLAQVVAQQSERSGFGASQGRANHFNPISQPPRRPNHFERPSQLGQRTQQQNSLQRVAGPLAESNGQKSKLSHDEALQRNALHRQQLAEVVAKHEVKVEQAVRTLGIPDTPETNTAHQQEPPQSFHPANKAEAFLAKKASRLSPASSSSSNSATIRPRQPSKPTAGGAGGELDEHLLLLSELDRQVEQLFNQSLDIFAEDDDRPGKTKAGRKGPGKGSRRKAKLDHRGKTN